MLSKSLGCFQGTGIAALYFCQGEYQFWHVDCKKKKPKFRYPTKHSHVALHVHLLLERKEHMMSTWPLLSCPRLVLNPPTVSFHQRQRCFCGCFSVYAGALWQYPELFMRFHHAQTPLSARGSSMSSWLLCLFKAFVLPVSNRMYQYTPSSVVRVFKWSFPPWKEAAISAFAYYWPQI